MRCPTCNDCISQWEQHKCEEIMTDNQESIQTGELDIGLPSSVEVARQLEGCFNQEQAETIAEYVYQPLRELLRNYIIGKL